MFITPDKHIETITLCLFAWAYTHTIAAMKFYLWVMRITQNQSTNTTNVHHCESPEKAFGTKRKYSPQRNWETFRKYLPHTGKFAPELAQSTWVTSSCALERFVTVSIDRVESMNAGVYSTTIARFSPNKMILTVTLWQQRDFTRAVQSYLSYLRCAIFTASITFISPSFAEQIDNSCWCLKFLSIYFSKMSCQTTMQANNNKFVLPNETGQRTQLLFIECTFTAMFSFCHQSEVISCP